MFDSKKKEGFLRLPNKVMDNLCKYRLSGREMRVLLAIIRMTIGWRRDSAQISFKRLENLTGIPAPKCYEVITSLANKGLIEKTIVQSKGNKITSYKFRTDISLEVFPKRAILPKRGIGSIPQKGNARIPREGNTPIPQAGKHKRHIYKDINTERHSLQSREPKDLPFAERKEEEVLEPSLLSDVEIIQYKWNSFANAHNLPPIRDVKGERLESLRLILKEKSFDFDRLLAEIKESRFLLGKNPNTDFKASFDWVIKPSNYQKAMEGNYRSRDPLSGIKQWLREKEEKKKDDAYPF